MYTHTHNSPILLPSLSNLSLLLALSDGCILNMRLEPYKVPIIPIILNLFKINGVFYIYIHCTQENQTTHSETISGFFLHIFKCYVSTSWAIHVYSCCTIHVHYRTQKRIVKKKNNKNTITIDPIFISTIKETGNNCSTNITGTSIKIFSHSFFV